MTFTARPNDDINGIADWIKLPNPQARYYPAGFGTESEAVGSVYVAPATAAGRVLNLTSASAIFAGGNLAADFANSITLGVSNKVTNLSNNALTLTFKPATGVFIGSVVDPASGLLLPFKGAVFQKLNTGCGLLLGTNQSSQVLIMP